MVNGPGTVLLHFLESPFLLIRPKTFILTCLMRILMISIYLHILIVFTFYWDTTHITNTFSINFIFWIPNTEMSFWFKFKWWSQRKKLKKLKSQSLFEPHGTVKHNVLNSANQDFDFLILILKHVFNRFIPIPKMVKKNCLTQCPICIFFLIQVNFVTMVSFNGHTNETFQIYLISFVELFL